MLEFTDEKFEQLRYGKICNMMVTPYKVPTRQETGNEKGKEKIAVAS